MRPAYAETSKTYGSSTSSNDGVAVSVKVAVEVLVMWSSNMSHCN